MKDEKQEPRTTEPRWLFELRVLWTFLLDIITRPRTATRLRVDTHKRRVWLEDVDADLQETE